MNIHSIHAIQKTSGQENFEFGTVLSITKQGYLVQLDSGSTQLSKKAFSCTFNPALGDYVSLIKSPNKGLFVTNILQRKSNESAVLEVDHDLQIRSNQRIDVQSNEINTRSSKHQVTSDQYEHISQHLNLHTQSAHFQSETVDSHVGRIMQRVKDSFKVIERIEQLQAKDLIQNIKNAFIQRSKQVDITAKHDVKINGDRIHMG